CTSDNGYAIAGSKLPNGGATDVSVIKVDSSGHNSCFVNLILNTTSINIPDSNLIPGTTPGNYPFTTALLATGSGGNTHSLCPTTNFITENKLNELSFNPNPFHSSSSLELEDGNSQIQNCELIIFSTLG